MAIQERESVRAKPRLVGLDLLRLLAVTLVLGRHMLPPTESLTSGWSSLRATWHTGGWAGVDLFFVLSGFLVSGLLFSEYKTRGSISIGRFYTRRGWKIYPPFIALIAATLVINPILGWPIDRQRLASELLFVQSYAKGLWNHTWSLAVEEHFYLLLPLVLMLLFRLNRGSPTPLQPVLRLSALVAATSLLLRLITWRSQPTFDPYTHMYASHLRLDSLFFGVAISYTYHFHRSEFVDRLFPWRMWLIVGGVLLFVPAFVLEIETNPFLFVIGPTLFYLGSGLFLAGMLLCQLPHNRVVDFLAKLGANSYSIYLWHIPVNVWGIALIEWMCGATLGFAAQTVVYLIGSFAIGLFMARIVEIPAARIKDRWFPPRAQASVEMQPTEARAI